MNILKLFLDANILIKLSICILIGFSIVSWGVIFHKVFILRREKYNFYKFRNKFWSGMELNKLYQEISIKRNKLSSSESIFYSGFQEFSRSFHLKKYYIPETINNRIFQVMQNTMNMELENLENYIPMIGTIGSISPYVGLFGTVLGIIHVFIELGTTTSSNLGNIDIVAPGIAEALISTAFGLFVSIPSIIAFNYLMTKINNFNQIYNNFIEEFVSVLYQQTFLNFNTDLEKTEEYEKKSSKTHDSS